jgi:hypothetical protein
MLNTVTAGAPRGLYNDACSLLTLYVNLRDHKAGHAVPGGRPHRGLRRCQRYGRCAQFLLAAGSAGIEAATNIVVTQAWRQMLLLVYAAVVLLASSPSAPGAPCWWRCCRWC